MALNTYTNLIRSTAARLLGLPYALNLASFGIDWNPGIGVRRTGKGTFVPTLEAADLLANHIAANTVHTYYVDSVNGATGNAGTSAAPYLNILTPYNLTPTETTIEIRVRPPANRMLWGARGTTNGGVAQRNIIIRADDGGELIIAGTASSVPPTWTANGDGTYTCTTNLSTTSVSPPVDWSPEARAEQIDGLGRYFALTKGTTAANDATIRANLQPGQAYKNTATGTADLTIRPFGDRAQTVWQAYLVPCTGAANFMNVNALDAYSDSPFFYFGRCLITGGSAFTAQNRRTTVGGRGTVILDQCGVVGTAASANAVGMIGAWTLYDYDFKCDGIQEDALNVHNGVNSDPTWISGSAWAVHVRPTVGYVGLANSGTSNNQTEHNDCRAFAIMPLYRGGNGRPYASIENSKSTIFGGSLGPSVRTQAQGYTETVSAAGTSTTGVQFTMVEMSNVGVSQGPIDIAADISTLASVKLYGMTQGALRISGNVTFNPMPSLIDQFYPVVLPAVPTAALLTIPDAGFSDTTWWLTPQREANGLFTLPGFNINTYKVATTSTMYVDIVNGSDSNTGAYRTVALATAAGVTSGGPKKTIGTATTGAAAAAADLTTIIVTGTYTADTILRGVNGLGGTAFTKQFNIIVEPSTTTTDARIMFANPLSQNANVWTLYSGTAGTPGAIYSAASKSGGVIDTSIKQYAPYALYADITLEDVQQIKNAPPMYGVASRVANLAAVVPGTMGTYWTDDSSITYYAPFDGRDLTIAANYNKIILAYGANNVLSITLPDAGKFYGENFDCLGGNSIRILSATTTGTMPIATFNKVSVQGSTINGSSGTITTSSSNGLSVTARAKILTYRCAGFYNGGDDFNYRSSAGAGPVGSGGTAGTSPWFIEIENVLFGGGYTGGIDSDQNSTCGDDSIGQRVNGVYFGARNQHISDTHLTWTIGTALCESPGLPTIVHNYFLSDTSTTGQNYYMSGVRSPRLITPINTSGSIPTIDAGVAGGNGTLYYEHMIPTLGTTTPRINAIALTGAEALMPTLASFSSNATSSSTVKDAAYRGGYDATIAAGSFVPTFTGGSAITTADIGKSFMMSGGGSAGNAPLIAYVISDGSGGWKLDTAATITVTTATGWDIGFDISDAWNAAVAAGGYRDKAFSKDPDLTYLVRKPQGLVTTAECHIQNWGSLIIFGGPPVGLFTGRGIPLGKSDFSSDNTHWTGTPTTNFSIRTMVRSNNGPQFKASDYFVDQNPARSLCGPSVYYASRAVLQGVYYRSTSPSAARGFGLQIFNSSNVTISGCNYVNVYGLDNGQDGTHTLASCNNILHRYNTIFGFDDSYSITIEFETDNPRYGTEYNTNTTQTNLTAIGNKFYSVAHSVFKLANGRATTGLQASTASYGNGITNSKIQHIKFGVTGNGNIGTTYMRGGNNSSTASDGNLVYLIDFGYNFGQNLNNGTGSVTDDVLIQGNDLALLWPVAASADYVARKHPDYVTPANTAAVPGGYAGYEQVYVGITNLVIDGNSIIGSKRGAILAIDCPGIKIINNTRRLQDILQGVITSVAGQPTINLIRCAGYVVQGDSTSAPSTTAIGKSSTTQAYLIVDGTIVVS